MLSDHEHSFERKWRCEHLYAWQEGIPEEGRLLDVPCGKGRFVFRCRSCSEVGYPIPNGVKA